MQFRKAIRLCGVYLLAAVMLWVPTTVARAEMLSTQKSLQSLESTTEKREWFTAMVLREEVQTQLREYGLSQEESLNRVNSMTDEEIASVTDQIEQYVAAGDPLWKASGEQDPGYVFALVIGVIVLGCLAFCWIIFI